MTRLRHAGMEEETSLLKDDQPLRGLRLDGPGHCWTSHAIPKDATIAQLLAGCRAAVQNTKESMAISFFEKSWLVLAQSRDCRLGVSGSEVGSSTVEYRRGTSGSTITNTYEYIA